MKSSCPECGERFRGKPGAFVACPSCGNPVAVTKEAPTEKKREVEALPLLEDHNYYLDQRLLLMPRKAVVAAAERLVARGALEKASRVYHLRVGELVAALRGDDAGVRETADRRREELAHYRTVAQPSHIGAPPPEVGTFFISE